MRPPDCLALQAPCTLSKQTTPVRLSSSSACPLGLNNKFQETFFNLPSGYLNKQGSAHLPSLAMVAAAAVPTMPPPEITTSADIVDAERCAIVIFLWQDNLRSVPSPAINLTLIAKLVWGRRHRLGLAIQPNIFRQALRQEYFQTRASPIIIFYVCTKFEEAALVGLG